MQLTTGSSLQAGKYILNQALDRQGVGLTYQATYTPTQKTVVVKLLNAALQVRPDFAKLRQRFIDRTRLLARCQHPCLPKVLDFFMEGEIPCLVMEWIAGDSFAELVKTGQGLSEREAIYYIRQVGLALEHAHQQGLLHGNLLPQHFLRRSGSSVVSLVGFESLGLAHPKSPYSAPERRSGQANHPSTDLYALAAILYHLLTGHPPLLVALTETDAESGQLLKGDTRLIDQLPLLPLLSPAAQQAIRSGMGEEVQQRPANMTVWLNLLVNQAMPNPAPAKPISAAATADSPTSSNPAHSTQRTEPIHATAHSPAAPPVPAIAAQLPRFRTEPLPDPKTVPEATSEAALNVRPVPTSMAESGMAESGMAESGSLVLLEPAGTTIHAKPDPVKKSKVPVTTSLFPKKVLMLTACAATAIGISFGLALRFKAAQTPGSGIFRVGQSFPEREWKGTLEPTMDVDIPIEQAGGALGAKGPQVNEDIPFFPEPKESPLPPRTRLTPQMVERPLPEIPAPAQPIEPPSYRQPAVEPEPAPAVEPAPRRTAPEPRPAAAPEPIAPPAVAPEPAPPAVAPEPAPPAAAPEPPPTADPLPPSSSRPTSSEAVPIPSVN
ncbi:MAG: protein kinase [Synechococcales bacterium]|nr:protein kinase [Synechococcales bacterium]